MSEPKLLAEWFLTDRWMGSSGFLLAMEPRGLYREMLTQAWRRGGSLPNDHEAIRRACGATTAEWRRCWPKVEKFWRVVGDQLVNDTQVEIYADAKARSDRASERGKAGAQAKLKQNLSDTQAPLEQHSSTTQAALKDKPPSLTPSPSPSNGNNGPSSPARERPPNPLVDRDKLRTEGYRLVGVIAAHENLDPTEVMKKASKFKGHSTVNLDSMNDDYMAQTVASLRTWARKCTGEAEPEMPTATEEPYVSPKAKARQDGFNAELAAAIGVKGLYERPQLPPGVRKAPGLPQGPGLDSGNPEGAGAGVQEPPRPPDR